MSDAIIKRDERGNIIYYKSSSREDVKYEYWKEYDKNNNIIHYRSSNGFEYWSEYDGDHETHCINNEGDEAWYKYDESNRKKIITKQEFEKIEEQEFLSREPIPRFELMLL